MAEHRPTAYISGLPAEVAAEVSDTLSKLGVNVQTSVNGHGFPPPAHFELPWDDPDPLRSTVERLLAAVAPADVPGGHALPDVFGAALAVWVAAIADEFNDGRRFYHPRTRSDRVL